MAIALSVTALVLGASLYLASVLVVAIAAPTQPIPFWRNPSVARGASIGLRLAGVFLVVIGTLSGLSPVIGQWALIPLVAAFAPAIAAILVHNALLRRNAAA